MTATERLYNQIEELMEQLANGDITNEYYHEEVDKIENDLEYLARQAWRREYNGSTI